MPAEIFFPLNPQECIMMYGLLYTKFLADAPPEVVKEELQRRELHYHGEPLADVVDDAEQAMSQLRYDMREWLVAMVSEPFILEIEEFTRKNVLKD